MGNVVTQESKQLYCPDCNSDLEYSETGELHTGIESIDGETASGVVKCVNCDFRGVEVWDFVRLERLEE